MGEKNFVLYESWAREIFHFEFNKCMLNIISEICSEGKIIYCGDKEQIELLKKNLKDKKNIEYKQLKILDYTKEKKIKLLIQEFKNLNEIKKIEAQNYFFINCLPHTLILINLLFSKKNKKYGILHGLDQLYNPKGIYKFFGLGLWLSRNNNIGFIVLGESIKTNLLKMFPTLDKKLYFIDHPYSFNESLKINNLEKNRVKIGTVGSATEEKGFFDYIEVIKNTSGDKFKFFHIGTTNSLNRNCENLEIPSPEIPLSNEEYSKYISSLDFILYFYPKESYRLTASGAIFDALKHNKPIIAIKNEYFEYVFKKSGDFGFLFDTKEEIIKFLNQQNIEKIISNEIFKENIEKAKKIFSEENIKIQLEKIIKNNRSE